MSLRGVRDEALPAGRQESRQPARRFIRFDDHTEFQKLPEIIGLLENGRNVVLVSDAGTPLIADPGYKLVRECRKRGIRVESIPGPSALLAALTSSGLPADRFTFLGYAPEKQSHRIKMVQALSPDTTYIMYAAPHKLLQTLEDMKTALGDIEVTAARELTKIHEEIWSGKISEAITRYAHPQGEFVLLFRL